MPKQNLFQSFSEQQVLDLFQNLLDIGDYFNIKKIDQIQSLTIKHTDYFDIPIWQNLLRQQPNLAQYYSEFIEFYLKSYKKIGQAEQSYLCKKSFASAELDAEYKLLSLFERNLYLQYWLRVFSPFSFYNVELTWSAFTEYPLECFILVMDLPLSSLESEKIEVFYMLIAQKKLDFVMDGYSPTAYIQNFYDLFPKLLLEIPVRFTQTKSKNVKQELMYCLSCREEILPKLLQYFILDTFIKYERKSSKSMFHACLDALQQCKQIEVPPSVFKTLKKLLHDKDMWYVPMLAMRALHGIGVKDEWFKAHLLIALDDPYGCDGESPQRTSIQLLVMWGEEGLYAIDKITQCLKQALNNDDQDTIENLTLYLNAYPQIVTHFHPLLWELFVDLSQRPQDECWINETVLKSFLKLSADIKWQPHQQEWVQLEVVLHEFLEYQLQENRETYFGLLQEQLQLSNETIQQLKQWCLDKDAENLAQSLAEQNE